MYSIPSAGSHVDSVEKLLLPSVQVARVPAPLESSTTRAYNHVSYHPNFCWYFVHRFFTLKHTHTHTRQTASMKKALTRLSELPHCVTLTV